MNAKHQPEPWRAKQLYRGGNPQFWAVYGLPHPVDGGDYAPICNTSEPEALRIAACVNACASIPTEALEAGVVGEMLETLDWLMPIITDLACSRPVGDIHELMNKARSVISKAKGEGDTEG